MLRRLSQAILWRYADDVPIEKTRRHHRSAMGVVYVFATTGALMLSSMAESLLARGLWQQISPVILIATTAVALLTALPATLCWAWAHEIERTLSARGYPLPAEKSIEVCAPRYAMKTCLGVVGLVLAFGLVRRGH